MPKNCKRMSQPIYKTVLLVKTAKPTIQAGMISLPMPGANPTNVKDVTMLVWFWHSTPSICYR